MNIPFATGYAWMLTIIVFSSATLGGAFNIESLLNLLDRSDAEIQYEKLQFHGTIINLSDKDIAGTADLSWGKWMPNKSPQFPIYAKGIMTFASQGRASSPSGTTGQMKLTAKGSSGEFRLNFDCPFSGSNKCDISGHIPGLKFERVMFSGSGGSVASCTMQIVKA